MAHRIRTTYEIVTPESAEQGDAEDRGWIDEEGEEIEPSEEEGVAEVAAAWLRDKGIAEASSSDFHPGIWYIGHSEQDYSTGAEETHSYHLKGFTSDEEAEVYGLLFPSRHKNRAGGPVHVRSHARNLGGRTVVVKPHERNRSGYQSRFWRNMPPGTEGSIPGTDARAMVQYQPYSDTPYDVARGSVGTIEVFFASAEEAQSFFDLIVSSGDIERAELRLDAKGYPRGKLVSEWSDPQLHENDNMAGDTKNSESRLQSELMYARQEYRVWAQQEHRLTREEYADKMKAERRVAELENAVTKLRSR